MRILPYISTSFGFVTTYLGVYTGNPYITIIGLIVSACCLVSTIQLAAIEATLDIYRFIESHRR